MAKIVFFEVEAVDRAKLEELVKGHEFAIYEHIPTEQEIIEKSEGMDVISTFIYTRVTKRVIDALPDLKLIATRSTGFDHIDVKYAKEKGVATVNVPQYGPNTVAEHAFALLLSVIRKVPYSFDSVKQGKFDYHGFRGYDLQGRTFGVLGTGRIGLHALKIAKGFGMRLLAYDVVLNEKAADEIGYTYVSLEELLQNSDIISIHVPLLESTYHLIDDDKLQYFKKGAILINTARGGIVNTETLIKGLSEGILGGVGIDVIEDERNLTKEHPLLKMENVVITPHTAFYTQEAMHRIMNTTIENIDAFFRGEKRNVVELQ